MRILLTGKNGQLGFELQRALSVLGEVTAVDSADCDLSDSTAVRNLVQRCQPQVIVNPAAYTAVDKAEVDHATAHAVNAVAPTILGEEARKLGAAVVHYSTDYVFDGSADLPYTEEMPTAPLNAYGRSKRDGESGLANATPDHLIFRTSWVVGANGHNFARTMLKLAQEREELRVVADQWGAPTSASMLADVTALLVRDMTCNRASFPFGLYHLTASGETNWCDYARFVLRTAQARGIALKATPERVFPVTTAEFPTAARRPKNSRLNCDKFESTFGLRLPPWQDGLNHILQQIL